MKVQIPVTVDISEETEYISCDYLHSTDIDEIGFYKTKIINGYRYWFRYNEDNSGPQWLLVRNPQDFVKIKHISKFKVL